MQWYERPANNHPKSFQRASDHLHIRVPLPLVYGQIRGERPMVDAGCRNAFQVGSNVYMTTETGYLGLTDCPRLFHPRGDYTLQRHKAN